MGMTTLCQQVLRSAKGLKIVLVLLLVLVLEKPFHSDMQIGRAH